MKMGEIFQHNLDQKEKINFVAMRLFNSQILLGRDESNEGKLKTSVLRQI